MDGFSIVQSGAPIRLSSRSMGLKLLVVCALAVFMTIPALFVMGLVGERTHRASAVVLEISGNSGGQQNFLGPTLAIPYKIAPNLSANVPKRNTYLIFPSTASAVLETTTEERHRSLFKVPVFHANVRLDAEFDLTNPPTPQGAELEWSRAEIVVGVSDARGALADATLVADGKSTVLVPSEIASEITLGPEQMGGTKLTLFGTKLDAIAKPNDRFKVSSSLRFSGAQRVAVLAYGKTTRLTAQGDWPSPGFDGGFLPTRRTVTQKGFTAEWSVPFIARGVGAAGSVDSLAGLQATALGTSFIEVADPYQSVERSLKYVLLFLGLIFLSYFVFEVGTGKRVHPAQYVLVGIAQIIFYLLLLSLAERIGFDWAFLLAGAATVALLSANAGWVFASRLQGLRALATFAVLYALIYILLRMEDNALLVGAIASFLAVSATMYLTRKIDWYGSLAAANAPPSVHDPHQSV
ncbi:MAG TPA: cell envelope integrity protein CreD [Bryobacteraceae bacterium]|nr:cell envelope integrity protein CreD [Bryobacteraceae bacterium]